MELKEAIKISQERTNLIDKYIKQGMINESDQKANEALKVLIKKSFGVVNWKDVKDKLPIKKGFYVCWCGNEVGLIHYHKDTGWQNGFYNDVVTHWAEITPPIHI